MWTWKYVCTHVCMCVNVEVCMHICMYVCMWTWKYVCTYVCLYGFPLQAAAVLTVQGWPIIFLAQVPGAKGQAATAAQEWGEIPGKEKAIKWKFNMFKFGPTVWMNHRRTWGKLKAAYTQCLKNRMNRNCHSPRCESSQSESKQFPVKWKISVLFGAIVRELRVSTA